MGVQLQLSGSNNSNEGTIEVKGIAADNYSHKIMQRSLQAILRFLL